MATDIAGPPQRYITGDVPPSATDQVGPAGPDAAEGVEAPAEAPAEVPAETAVEPGGGTDAPVDEGSADRLETGTRPAAPGASLPALADAFEAGTIVANDDGPAEARAWLMEAEAESVGRFDRVFRMLSDGNHGFNAEGPRSDGELEHYRLRAFPRDGRRIEAEFEHTATAEDRQTRAILSLSPVTVAENGASRISHRQAPDEARALLRDHLVDPATRDSASESIMQAVAYGLIDAETAESILRSATERAESPELTTAHRFLARAAAAGDPQAARDIATQGAVSLSAHRAAEDFATDPASASRHLRDLALEAPELVFETLTQHVGTDPQIDAFASQLLADLPTEALENDEAAALRRALSGRGITSAGDQLPYAARWGDAELLALRNGLDENASETLQFVADNWESFVTPGDHERPSALQSSIAEIVRSRVRGGDADMLRRGVFALGDPPWDPEVVRALQREPPDSATFARFDEVVSALPERVRANIASTLSGRLGEDRVTNDETARYLLPLSDQLSLETMEAIVDRASAEDSPELDPALARALVLRAARSPSRHRERFDGMLAELGVSETDRAALLGYASGVIPSLDGVPLSPDARALLDESRLGRTPEEILRAHGVENPEAVLAEIAASEDYDPNRLGADLGALAAINSLPPELRARVLGEEHVDLLRLDSAGFVRMITHASDRATLARYTEALDSVEDGLRRELEAAELQVREAQGRVEEASEVVDAAARAVRFSGRVSNWEWFQHNVVPWIENESELEQEDRLRGLRAAEASLELARGGEMFEHEGREVPGLVLAARNAELLRAAAANGEYEWRQEIGLGAADVAYEQAVRSGGEGLSPDMRGYLEGPGWERLRTEYPERFNSEAPPGLLLGPSGARNIPVEAIETPDAAALDPARARFGAMVENFTAGEYTVGPDGVTPVEGWSRDDDYRAPTAPPETDEVRLDESLLSLNPTLVDPDFQMGDTQEGAFIGYGYAVPDAEANIRALMVGADTRQLAVERTLEAAATGIIPDERAAELLEGAAETLPDRTDWLNGENLREVARLTRDRGAATALAYTRANVTARREVTIGDPLSLDAALELGATGGTEERQLAFDTVAQHPDVARVLEATGAIAEDLRVIETIGAHRGDITTYDAVVDDLKTRAGRIQAHLNDPEILAGIERFRSRVAELPEDHPMREDLARIEEQLAYFEGLAAEDSAVRQLTDPILDDSFRGDDFEGWLRTDGPAIAGQIAGAVAGTIVATAAAPVSGGTSYAVLGALMFGAAGGAIGGVIGGEVARELVRNSRHLGDGSRSRLMMAIEGEMEWGDMASSYGTELAYSGFYQLLGMGGAMALGNVVHRQMVAIASRSGMSQEAAEAAIRRLGPYMERAGRSPVDFRNFMRELAVEFPQEASSEVLAAAVVHAMGGSEAGWEGAAMGALIGGLSRITNWNAARVESFHGSGRAIIDPEMDLDELRPLIDDAGIHVLQEFRGPDGQLQGVLTQSPLGTPFLLARDGALMTDAAAAAQPNNVVGPEVLARGRITRGLVDVVAQMEREGAPLEQIRSTVAEQWAAGARRWNALNGDPENGGRLDPNAPPGATAESVEALLAELRAPVAGPPSAPGSPDDGALDASPVDGDTTRVTTTDGEVRLILEGDEPFGPPVVVDEAASADGDAEVALPESVVRLIGENAARRAVETFGRSPGHMRAFADVVTAMNEAGTLDMLEGSALSAATQNAYNGLPVPVVANIGAPANAFLAANLGRIRENPFRGAVVPMEDGVPMPLGPLAQEALSLVPESQRAAVDRFLRAPVSQARWAELRMSMPQTPAGRAVLREQRAARITRGALGSLESWIAAERAAGREPAVDAAIERYRTFYEDGVRAWNEALERAAVGITAHPNDADRVTKDSDRQRALRVGLYGEDPLALQLPEGATPPGLGGPAARDLDVLLQRIRPHAITRHSGVNSDYEPRYGYAHPAAGQIFMTELGMPAPTDGVRHSDRAFRGPAPFREEDMRALGTLAHEADHVLREGELRPISERGLGGAANNVMLETVAELRALAIREPNAYYQILQSRENLERFVRFRRTTYAQNQPDYFALNETDGPRVDGVVADRIWAAASFGNRAPAANFVDVLLTPYASGLLGDFNYFEQSASVDRGVATFGAIRVEGLRHLGIAGRQLETITRDLGWGPSTADAAVRLATEFGVNARLLPELSANEIAMALRRFDPHASVAPEGYGPLHELSEEQLAVVLEDPSVINAIDRDRGLSRIPTSVLRGVAESQSLTYLLRTAGDDGTNDVIEPSQVRNLDRTDVDGLIELADAIRSRFPYRPPPLNTASARFLLGLSPEERAQAKTLIERGVHPSVLRALGSPGFESLDLIATSPSGVDPFRIQQLRQRVTMADRDGSRDHLETWLESLGIPPATDSVSDEGVAVLGGSSFGNARLGETESHGRVRAALRDSGFSAETLNELDSNTVRELAETVAEVSRSGPHSATFAEVAYGIRETYPGERGERMVRELRDVLERQGLSEAGVPGNIVTRLSPRGLEAARRLTLLHGVGAPESALESARAAVRAFEGGEAIVEAVGARTRELAQDERRSGDVAADVLAGLGFDPEVIRESSEETRIIAMERVLGHLDDAEVRQYRAELISRDGEAEGARLDALLDQARSLYPIRFGAELPNGLGAPSSDAGPIVEPSDYLDSIRALVATHGLTDLTATDVRALDAIARGAPSDVNVGGIGSLSSDVRAAVAPGGSLYAELARDSEPERFTTALSLFRGQGVDHVDFIEHAVRAWHGIEDAPTFNVSAAALQNGLGIGIGEHNPTDGAPIDRLVHVMSATLNFHEPSQYTSALRAMTTDLAVDLPLDTRPEVIRAGVELTDRMRRNLPIPQDKNVAFAEIDIALGDGVFDATMRAVSGDSSRRRRILEPQGWTFQVDNPQLGYLPSRAYRSHDTESIIVNNIAERLNPERREVVPEARGRVEIFSRIPCCASCQLAMLQFQRMFPNVELVVSSGPPYGEPIP